MSNPTEKSPSNYEDTNLATLKTSIPLVKSTRFTYKDDSWAVYQLPNGELVMSDHQMSLPLGQSKKSAKKFVQMHKLPTITIQIPNRKVVDGYPLTTVAAYWQHLYETGQIPKQLPAGIDWEDLIKSLKNGTQETPLNQLPEAEATDEEQFTQPTLTPAKPIVLKLQERLQLRLEVLELQDNEYRISFESGLAVAGLFPNWLLDLPSSRSRLKKLEKMGFSGVSKQCSLKTPEGYLTVESLSIDDWLTIWEFLASRGNSKAAAVLKACALENIPSRVEAAKKTYPMQKHIRRSTKARA